jgi:hypothetical protein
MNEPGKNEVLACNYARLSLDKRLSGRLRRFVKSATIRPGNLFQMRSRWENRPESAAFLGQSIQKRVRKNLPSEALLICPERKRRGPGAAWCAARRFYLLTGPNHLYISTNEPAEPPAGMRLPLSHPHPAPIFAIREADCTLWRK